ncbi:MAG TPA: exodeoxyribonuclease VII small subunit, partial [Candidatus Poseidoniales archaeon]|nr:exodeoxyribonuclease VII small subunit [Candidatus Poseidoniales archaeon]
MPGDEDAELNFSQALQRLEALLGQLESGEVELEEAMELF